MVNPSARQVVAAVRAAQPGIVPADGTDPASRLARAAGSLTRRWPWRGHAAHEPHGRTSSWNAGRQHRVRPIARLWSRIRGDSVISVLARGAVSGLAGFCAGPILGAVLTVAAGSGAAAARRRAAWREWRKAGRRTWV